MNCPICDSKLHVWYSMRDAMVCICCPNGECILFKKNVTGHGDSTIEALEHFEKQSLKFEANKP